MPTHGSDENRVIELREGERLKFYAERKRKLQKRIGERYENCTIQNYEMSENQEIAKRQISVIQKMRMYSERFRENVQNGVGLLFFGTVGTGKDHLMAAMMLEACDRQLSVQWHDGVTLARELRSTIDGYENEGEIIEKAIAADVLAISDPLPPGGILSNFLREKIFAMVDGRSRHRKGTWMTLNVASREEADSRMGAQIIDRVSDGAMSIGFEWKSHREPMKFGITKKWESLNGDEK